VGIRIFMNIWKFICLNPFFYRKPWDKLIHPNIDSDDFVEKVWSNTCVTAWTTQYNNEQYCFLSLNIRSTDIFTLVTPKQLVGIELYLRQEWLFGGKNCYSIVFHFSWIVAMVNCHSWSESDFMKFYRFFWFFHFLIPHDTCILNNDITKQRDYQQHFVLFRKYFLNIHWGSVFAADNQNVCN